MNASTALSLLFSISKYDFIINKRKLDQVHFSKTLNQNTEMKGKYKLKI